MAAVYNWLSEYIKETESAAGLLTADQINKRVEALREMLINHDKLTPNQFMEAMTVAHFDAYFSDALSRRFYSAYQYRGGAWSDYTFPDTVADFRDVKRFRMGEMGTLNKRREKGESKAQGRSMTNIAYGVDEFSKSFDVSWRVILNDDLGAIAETPAAMLRATRRFEDGFVNALYDNAVTQATLAALGSPWAGTGRLTEPNLAVAVTAMRTRTDADGNKMQINRIWLVIPPELEITAGKILNSQQVAGSANNDTNEVRKYIAGVRVDPYIETSGANQPWYLIADPSEIPAITVARMQGWPGPIVFKRRSDIEIITGQAPAAFLMGSFDSGNIEYTVEDVIGGWDDAAYGGVTDYRGIYYSSGTTA
jgi:hypothetical protein